MSIKELTQQYKKEKCTNCKNQCKEFTQCCITINRSNIASKARCDYYEPKWK